VTYHNSSPLENMHAAVLVRLMLQPSLNFLSHLSSDVFKTVRKYAAGAILCTDPAAHRLHMDVWQKHSSKWKKRVESVQSTYVDMCTEGAMGQEEILSALGMLLKCADVGHMAQPFQRHKVWVDELTEEFYQQGDREQALGMSVLPFMNRDKKHCVPSSQVPPSTILPLLLLQGRTRSSDPTVANISTLMVGHSYMTCKWFEHAQMVLLQVLEANLLVPCMLKELGCVQVGFMSFYALPMFDSMSHIFPEMATMTQAVKSNFDVWSSLPRSTGTT
jgi:hypothetical protein